MTGALERAPGLLHNIGGPPRASILWRGIGRGPLDDDAHRIEVARHRGSWLHLSLAIGQDDGRYHRDWNSAGALLRLLDPAHALTEAAAGRRLTDLIEACSLQLDWPRCLMVGNTAANRSGESAFRREQGITLDHAPTTFVALSKSTGSLWLRDRAPRLAPLHAPRLSDPRGKLGHSVRWDQWLWFPDGIPASLLHQAAAQLPPPVKTYRQNPMG
jgi:hypothetical protein